jgi:hypothetical protein
VNERIEELDAGKPSSMFEELRVSKSIDVACECMNEMCTERVTMTLAEYEEVRSDSNSFFVIPGHDVPEVEEVVRREEQYVVVRKLGAGALVAEKLDRRTREQ